MSEHLQPGLHPDADSLSAFIEGVLPERERLQCLAHLADCSRCREIVFLAQEPPPAVAAPKPAPAWRRWFAPIPALAAAAAVCVAVLAVSLYLHHTAGAPTRDVAARIEQSLPALAPGADNEKGAHVPLPVMPKAAPNTQQPRTKPGRARAARGAATEENSRAATESVDVSPSTSGSIPATTPAQQATTPTPAPPSPPPPPPLVAQSGNIQLQQLPVPPVSSSSIPPPPPANSPNVTLKDDQGLADSLSGISGTVTDASGAVIPGAAIMLRQLATGASRNARTDARGQFQLTGVAPGRYELQITRPGFQQTSRQIDLQPREIAAVNSKLEVGAVAESVMVTGEAPMINTTTSSVSSSIRKKDVRDLPLNGRSFETLAATVTGAGGNPLPSKLPATTTMASGKARVAVDSAGVLYFSSNEGKRWKAVKPVWRGKVVRLAPAEPPQTAIAAFQLTTDSDSTWLSRDGNHWFPAPPVH